MRRRLQPASVVFTLLLPAVAAADAGTPLIWFTAFHLLIGNALIGLGEGWLLSKVFSTPLRRSTRIMALANYTSAVVGVAYFALVGSKAEHLILGSEPLYRLGIYCLATIVVTFVITVIVEWPFVAWVLRGQKQLARRSFGGSLMAQAASYVLLTPLIAVASSSGLLHAVKRDPTVVAAANKHIQVFFIGQDGRRILRCELDGSHQVEVAAIPGNLQHAVLDPEVNSDGASWDLWAAELSKREDAKPILVQSRFAALDPVDAPASTRLARGIVDGRPPLALTGDSPWHARPPAFWDWPAVGIEVSNDKTGENYRVGGETPVLAWKATTGTLLPDDQILYELRSEPPQIVLLDMPSRRIGLVTLGSSPVAVSDGRIPRICPGCAPVSRFP